MQGNMKAAARWLASLGVFACCLTSAPSALAGESAPAWQVFTTSKPSNLIAGSTAVSIGGAKPRPAINSFIKNVGGATAHGAVISDQLPSGLSPSPASTPMFLLPKTAAHGEITGPCAVAGQAITCTVTNDLVPGDNIQVEVPLAVAPTAGPSVTDELTVEGGGAAAVTTRTEVRVTSEPPAFGSDGSAISGGVFDEVGQPPLAGAHPYVTSFHIEVPNKYLPGTSEVVPSEGLRSVGIDLPQGLAVDPTATNGRCPMATLTGFVLLPPVQPVFCPVETQVGEVTIDIGIGQGTVPLYNMIPPPGVPAELGFTFESIPVTIIGGLSGGFHLTAKSSDIISRFQTNQIAVYLWGIPSDPRHDAAREGEGCNLATEPLTYHGCSSQPSRAPFVTMPTSCAKQPVFAATVQSWLGNTFTRNEVFTSGAGEPVAVTGCNQLAFEPTITSKATTKVAETSSGLDFNIHQPQDESFAGRATAALKDVTVALPEGMTLNPAAGNGLSACTEQQMGYAPEEGKILFSIAPQSCPSAAKVGTIEASTPLLERTLPGAVYVAKPFDNPFGSLLSIYLALEDEETGIVAKLAGKVHADPITGQLTATFTENPELPIEDIHLSFFNGARGVLTTPLTCGTQTTTSTLVPWSTPEGADAHPQDSFETSVGCSDSEATAPRTASFTAGTSSPLSGIYSPFVLRLSRPDASQHFTGIETTLPEGLLGKLVGISYCPESGIAQARSREEPEKGKLEQQSPSCPASSQVGTVEVTAGSGSDPIPVSGRAYLAGPYKGAPLSMVVIVPAVAGPFDLGTVVDRVALKVGEYDARIHAVADPLPTIREGIPLDARSIELRLDRGGFTLNPTSCEVKQIEGSVINQAGQTTPLSNRFQVGECGRLRFKPSLKISLKGPTKRSGHPALKAVVTYPQKGEYTNIARAQVSLPHSEFLDQGNLNKVCKQAELSAGSCPAKAIYGRVKAWTPLLERPLEGNVYLGVGFGYKLPALVAELNGQIRVLLKGKTDTDKQHGIRSTFEAVPDAPVSRFVIELKGGKKYGLLENSENICRKTQKAGVSFRAQNGRVQRLSVRIANSCGKGKKSSKHRHHHRKAKQGHQHR